MSFYDDLGVRRVINGYATLTRLGGSLMPPVVLEAMNEAAEAFVDMELLAERVGEEIAVLTRNEAAFVTTGASGGIVLSTAAAIAGTDPTKRARLPHTDGLPNEIIVQRCAHVEHEFAIRQAGGKLVPIGDATKATTEELVTAINERTVAVFLVPRGSGPPGMIPVPQAVSIAHARGVRVIVDAAAQLPPPENLWRFTRDEGADVAIFSGGKGLCGPQSTGLILGRREMIEACAFHACPRPFIGRPLKVGKEEMAGVLAAVRWYLAQDHDALLARYEEQVAYLIDLLGRRRHVTAVRDFPSEAGQPMPRARIELDEEALGIARDELLDALRDGEPSIELAPCGGHALHVNPQTLRPGEEVIIARRIAEELDRAEASP